MKCLYMGATPDVISADDREAYAAMAPHLRREFGVPVLPMELPAIDFAYDRSRGQYGSIPVLEMLLKICPQGGRLLAVTTRDLFIPVLTFVFGHAQLSGRTGVVSLARLRQEFYSLPPDRDIFPARAVKEALHETGHIFGLVHCADRACAMSLSTGVRQIDFKKAQLCVRCATIVRRVTAARSETGIPDLRSPSPDSL